MKIPLPRNSGSRFPVPAIRMQRLTFPFPFSRCTMSIPSPVGFPLENENREFPFRMETSNQNIQTGCQLDLLRTAIHPHRTVVIVLLQCVPADSSNVDDDPHRRHRYPRRPTARPPITPRRRLRRRRLHVDRKLAAAVTRVWSHSDDQQKCCKVRQHRHCTFSFGGRTVYRQHLHSQMYRNLSVHCVQLKRDIVFVFICALNMLSERGICYTSIVITWQVFVF